MSLKRKMADGVGRLTGLYIVRRREVWNVAQIDFLERFLADLAVDCVFDVGANNGQYAARVRAAGFKGPIISFEPVPHLAKALRRKAASDPNWLIEEVALDETERQIDFNVMATHSFSSMLDPDHSETEAFTRGNRVTETICIKTGVLSKHLESYQNKLGFSRPFLKTDTQGADLAVAKGAARRLHEFVGLQSELSFVRIYRGQDDYRTAIDFYERNGFELAALLPNGPSGPFPRLVEIDCLMFNGRFVDQTR